MIHYNKCLSLLYLWLIERINLLINFFLILRTIRGTLKTGALICIHRIKCSLNMNDYSIHESFEYI